MILVDTNIIIAPVICLAPKTFKEAFEIALDVSDSSHLYAPVNSPADVFYKDIPEYEMLKRGMTDEERIRNGYWVAYQMAEIC